MKTICVYCSASNGLSKKYVDEALKLGEAIAKKGATLVYGGRTTGLMGKVAHSAKAHGAKVIGVILERVGKRKIVHHECDELIIAKTLRERKAIMEEKSDAFIALAGGFGTLDEVTEAIAIRQHGVHQKPIVFLNTDGFYNHLLSFFEQLYNEGFASRKMTNHYQVAKTVQEALTIALGESTTYQHVSEKTIR